MTCVHRPQQPTRRVPGVVAAVAMAIVVSTVVAGCGDTFDTSLPTIAEADIGVGSPTTVPRPPRPQDSAQLAALPDLGLGDDATVVDTELDVADLEQAVRDLVAAYGDDVELVELSVTSFGIEFAVREAPGASRLVDHDWDLETGLSAPSTPRPEDGPWFGLDGVDLEAPAALIDEIQLRAPGAEVLDVTLDFGVFDDSGLAWQLGVSSPVKSFEVRARLDGTVVAIVV